MSSERISRSLNQKQIHQISRFLDNLRDNEKFLTDFFHSPMRSLKKYGINFEELGIHIEDEKKLVSDLIILVSKMMNGKFVLDASNLDVMETSYQSSYDSGVDHNFDHSSELKTNYVSDTETKAGFKSEKATETSTESNFDFGSILDMGGITLVVERCTDGPLISARDLELIQSHLVNGIDQAMKKV